MSQFRQILCVTIALFSASCAATASAQQLHEVFAVKPGTPVFHGLHIKATLDAEQKWVSLRGPRLYSRPVEIGEGKAIAYLTWYEIRKPGPEPERKLTVKDQYSGDQSFQVTLGDPAYFAMPAQTISNGPPSDVPDDLNHYKVYRIKSPELLELPEPTPGKPAFVAIPAAEWHHDEQFPVKDANKLLMIYEIKPQPAEVTASIIDQFGLNRLKAESKTMVYVPAVRSE